MKVKSVMVLTTSFPLNTCIAAGIHVLEKCRNLVKNGLDVTVIAPHSAQSTKKETIEKIKVERFIYFLPTRLQKLAYGPGIPTNLKQNFLAKFQLPLFLLAFLVKVILKAKRFDILHCHWSLAGLVGVIAGKLLNKKVVFMMHGAEAFVLGNHPMLRFVLKNCDYLISNSTFTEKKTLDIYPVPNHSVVSPGVNLSRFYPQHTIPNLREKLDIQHDHVFLLTIGKFIPRKGIEYLIEAMDILINDKNYKKLRLRIGGRGPLKKKYQTLIIKYQLEDYIDFLPYIPDNDIPSYYTEADIFILPSIVDENRDTEGLGVVFLEANACATPVIGSRVGGIVDVIRDGINGYFVEQKNAQDLAEKIAKLVDSKSLRFELGQKGEKRVRKHFNWDTNAKEIIKIYKEMI